MTDTLTPLALYQLASWLSPAYPVGAFSYSHGLETAIAAGLVYDRASLENWGSDCLSHGAGRTDAILLAHAYRAPDDPEIADLARALAPSAERRLETDAQGAAFTATTSTAWGGVDDAPLPYPVAVGRAAAAHNTPLGETLVLYLHGFAAMMVGAAVRLVPLGQSDGQRVQAALAPTCQQVAEIAQAASLDDLGGATIVADIASMRHETQTTRLFRS